MGEIATELYADNMNMSIKLTFDKGPPVEFKLNQENRLVPQHSTINPTARIVTFNAHGSGIASLQVSHSYNTKLLDAKNYFNLTVKVAPSNNVNILHLDICTNFYPQEEEDSDKTGMALLEIAFPSGYVFDPASDLLSFADIKVSLWLLTKIFYDATYFELSEIRTTSRKHNRCLILRQHRF